jgi:hypothetical protein
MHQPAVRAVNVIHKGKDVLIPGTPKNGEMICRALGLLLSLEYLFCSDDLGVSL